MSKKPAMQTQAVPFQVDLEPQTDEHWKPSQEVPEGQLLHWLLKK
jgi:hypothetical protein